MNKLKVLICGGRWFSDYELLAKSLDKINISSIISGGCKGADKLAERYAEEHNIPIEIYKPDWNNISKPGAIIKYGNYGPYNAIAGFDRNEKMLLEDKPDLVIGFCGNNGTEHMLRLARKANVKIIHVT